jgi:hypothetical protein
LTGIDAEIRDQIISTANAMIDGSMCFIEGSRRIRSLSFETDDPKDRLFDLFIQLESETDDLPVGDERQYWAREALERADKRANEMCDSYRESMFEACHALIAAFASNNK